MKAVFLRTGSVPVKQPALPASPRLSLTRQNSVSGERPPPSVGSPRLSLNSGAKERRAPIRRAFSEADVTKSRSFVSRISEVVIEEENGGRGLGIGGFSVGAWPESGGIPVKELGFSGDGFGNGRRCGGGGGEGGSNGRFSGGEGNEWSRIGDYYREMLKKSPSDSLLLRNYAKFLHEVEGDMERAEEYYGRAIVASPGDGEVLCLYGNLIWEAHGDGERAMSYFDRAVSASPSDCTVLGSYAHFMWEVEEDENGEETNMKTEISPAMIPAF